MSLCRDVNDIQEEIIATRPVATVWFVALLSVRAWLILSARLQVASTLGETRLALDLKPLLKYSVQVRRSTLDDPPLWSRWSDSHQIKLYGEKSSLTAHALRFVSHVRPPGVHLERQTDSGHCWLCENLQVGVFDRSG